MRTLLSLSLTITSLVLSQHYAIGEEQAAPFTHNVTVTGIGEGPYNIGATARPQAPPAAVPMGPSIINPYQGELTAEQKREVQERHMDYMSGPGFDDRMDVFGDPVTTMMINTLVDAPVEAYRPDNPPKPTTTATAPPPTIPTPAPTPTPSSSPSSSNPESHHHPLPTDGSVGSDLVTSNAIESFYQGLPHEVTDYLNGGSGINLSGSDPYANYAQALQNHDFARMRDLANSQAINDFNQRIAMLGLAGAAALNRLANPQTSNDFAAKDTLKKVAEDLHYAGEGLDANNPNDAKLKTICAEISRIWSNMTNSGQ